MLYIRTLDVAGQVQISHLASSEKYAYTISLISDSTISSMNLNEESSILP